MIKEKLSQLETETLGLIDQATSVKHLEDIRVGVLGKKSQLTDILKGLGQASAEERPLLGQLANTVKQTLTEKIESKLVILEAVELEAQLATQAVDVTLPAKKTQKGTQHPLNAVAEEVLACLARLGFSVKEGPDIESDYYNFEALNIPAHHPARDMHDTFYVNPGQVLRTHTSPVQIRSMEAMDPPLKIAAHGKVFRCDADVTHSPVFHQIEGLYVDTQPVTFAQLKGTLDFFLKELFGSDKKVRFRPSYFPFTEPSAEVDVACVQCSGKGCGFCKHTGWLEILGAGLVHRNVFRAVGYDPDQVSGFAFGLGIERVAMLKYKINDIRLFYDNDVRFLRQF